METHAILPKEISTRKMADFVNHIVADLDAAESVRMTYLGSKLGLFKAMAFAGPMSPEEVALRAGSPVRLVEEWLKSQTKSGHVVYDPASGAYTLPTEHAIALIDAKSPFYIGGRFNASEIGKARELHNKISVTEDRNEAGKLEFEDASARFFNTEYITSLFDSWLPSVEGLTAKLQAGIAVADLGCGRHGASTLIMAEAYPASTFYGFDNYASSADRANLLAKQKRIRNVHFEVSSVENVHAQQYDLITLIECLHNMGKVEDMLHGCYEVLKPDGILVVVEAKDKERVEEELYQRLRSSNSMAVVSQKVKRSVQLGIDRKEKSLEEAAHVAGFTYISKVAETVYDVVYELRP